MELTDAPAIVVVSSGGLATAHRIAGLLPGSRVHGLRGRVGAPDVSFGETGAHLRALFEAGRPIVGVCAAGVLIRCLAPVLADKRAEPPVVAVAEDGSAIVPLLGGHHGANDLARQIARAFGAAAAVTTVGDLRFGISLEDAPSGWRLANPEDVKGFVAELLAGAEIRLDGEAQWLAESDLPFSPNGTLTLRVTDGRCTGDQRTLVYHPARLALGVGCERGVAPQEVIDLATGTLAGADLALQSVAAVVSIDLKADEAAIHAAARALDAPARFFTAEQLEAETPRLQNPSRLVFREVGSHGVAEAAALAAAGPEAALVVPKTKSRRATCAVARSAGVIAAEAVGVARGCLAVIGVGPGQAAWRTPEADGLLADASDVVGYRLYLELLEAALAGKTRHGFALGEEEPRVRAALEMAAGGRRVALVSSGDAGIYAMAALVFELLEREDRAAWNRVEIVIAPGVSAMQAAAARAGAPLGHDFCAISLSDLLTPWTVIEARIEAAAEGDFVTAFYNPVSKRRTRQLARARALLLRRRPPSTPVVVARNLGRGGESVDVTTLRDLDPKGLDMLSLVIVGSSATRTVPGRRPWVYTPRGYGDKSHKSHKSS